MMPTYSASSFTRAGEEVAARLNLLADVGQVLGKQVLRFAIVDHVPSFAFGQESQVILLQIFRNIALGILARILLFSHLLMIPGP